MHYGPGRKHPPQALEKNMDRTKAISTQTVGRDTSGRTIEESIQFFANLRNSWRFLSDKNASALKLMTDHHETKASAHSSMRSRISNSVEKVKS
jgi:hypothetical protein